MRRVLAALCAAPLVLLGACSDDASVVDAPEPAVTTPVAGPAGDDGATAAPPSDSDADAVTQTEPAGNAAVTTTGPDEVEGGADGQAAADRAKEFLLALVRADEEACTMVLSFSDTERPMADVPSDLELCQEQLPQTMAASVEAQGLGDEGIAILEAMQIRGAEVTGDTAVVDQDNYSPLFAEAMGNSTITLHRIDGEWYVDIDAFMDSPDDGSGG